jgi:hypothetical protein
MARSVFPLKSVWVIVEMTATVIVIATGLARGQGGATSALTGHVVDQSQAIVNGAKLVLTETNKGATYDTVSNSDGYFSFPRLTVGTYRLECDAPGFAQLVIESITIQVGGTANVDVTLRPGTVSSKVDVNGSALRLETQTSSVGSVVTNVGVRELPTNVRSPVYLVELVPGVTGNYIKQGFNSARDASGRGGLQDSSRVDFYAVGMPADWPVIIIDGANARQDHNGDSGTTLNVVPGPDFTQEFELETVNYSTEYSYGFGVLNIATKSGTNTLHGSGYEYLQNSALNANDFFNNARGVKNPPFRRNQYGFSLGGPVYIPHLYNGKDRTWFFVNFERLNQIAPSYSYVTVPTDAQKNGDFSQMYNAAGLQTILYNPFDTYIDPTTGAVMRHPFPNNRIPASISAFAQKIMSFYPSPNIPGGTIGATGTPTNIGNFFTGAASGNIYDRLDFKIDEQISIRHHLMFRYDRNPDIVVPPNYYGTIASPVSANSYFWNTGQLSHTWTVSPTFLITQHLTWSNEAVRFTTPGDGYDATQLGGMFANGQIASFGKQWYGAPKFPQLSIAGYGAMGASGLYANFQTGAYSLNFTKMKASHELKWGFQFEPHPGSNAGAPAYAGSYNWTGSWTCGPNPLQCSANTGNSLADMELGLIGSGSVSTNFNFVRRYVDYGWWIQDSWRVTPSLTLNLGVRYDLQPPAWFRPSFAVFDPSMPNPIGNAVGPNTNGQTLNQYFGRNLMGVWVFPQPDTRGSSSGILKTDISNLAPRIGFAYRFRDRWVMRGGFAKIYGLADNKRFGIPGGQNPFQATTNIVSTIDNIHPNVTLDNPFPNGFLTPSGHVTPLTGVGFGSGGAGVDNYYTPYMHQVNFGFQHALAGNSSVSVGYVGTWGNRWPCPQNFCVSQLPISYAQQYGAKLTNQVPNPFYGIITDPTSPLSAKTVSLAQTLALFPQFGVFAPSSGEGHPSAKDIWPFFQQQFPFVTNWNGLLVSFEKQWSQGLQLNVAYTWSKSLGNFENTSGNTPQNVAGYQNQIDLRQEYSLNASDVPHRLVVAHVYELPFGRGKHFGRNWNGVVDKALDGWQISGIITLASGPPLAATATPNNSFVGGTGVRPNLVATPTLTSGSLSARLQQWVNSAAFAQPAPGTFGTAPRVLAIRGDGIKNYDFSLAKTIPIWERLNMQLRMDAFNVFNHPRFSLPNMVFGSPTFGQVTSTWNTPRIVELGFRLVW